MCRIAGATSTSLSLTNVHLPTHTVAVVVTNPYGGVTSSVPLIVQDTLPPILTLNGSIPAYVELGSAFLDPGATAYDLCAGAVPVVATGTVNTNAVSTNTVTYTATDGNGNTNTATRTVIVRDTTPPAILWSFTNLVLAAGTNCTGGMPDVTGTNYILATDWSGTLTLTQVPTNNAALPLGTNVVVITVADASGNASYSTNQIVVQDQTPPVILLEPQSQTNTVGASAGFSVTAAACTPLAFQWYFDNAPLAAQTNSTLALSNLPSSAGGNYLVVVTAAGGSATSAVATLNHGAAADDHRSAVGTDRTMRQQRRLQRHDHRHAAAQLSMEPGRCAHCGRDRQHSVADQCPSAYSHRRGRGHQHLRRHDQFRGADRARYRAAGPHAQR